MLSTIRNVCADHLTVWVSLKKGEPSAERFRLIRLCRYKVCTEKKWRYVKLWQHMASLAAHAR